LIASDGDLMDVLFGPVHDLRAAIASKLSRSTPINERRELGNTKPARVIAMLRRNEGTSGPQVAEAMGWAPHTVRGLIAGLAKKGIKVHVLERVCQIGPNKAGAKRSITVYRVVGMTQL
jgi:hypothetical protein